MPSVIESEVNAMEYTIDIEDPIDPKSTAAQSEEIKRKQRDSIAQQIKSKIQKIFASTISDQLTESFAQRYLHNKETHFALPIQYPKNIPVLVRAECEPHPIATALATVEYFPSITIKLQATSKTPHNSDNNTYNEGDTRQRTGSIVEQYKKHVIQPISSHADLNKKAEELRNYCRIETKANTEHPDHIMIYRGHDEKSFVTRNLHARKPNKNSFTQDWANVVLIEDRVAGRRQAYIYDASTGLTDEAFTCGLQSFTVCAQGLIKITTTALTANPNIKIPSIQFVSTNPDPDPRVGADAYQLIHHLTGTLNIPMQMSIMRTTASIPSPHYYYKSKKSEPDADSAIVKAIKQEEQRENTARLAEQSAIQRTTKKSTIPNSCTAGKKSYLSCMISFFYPRKKEVYKSEFISLSDLMHKN